jgi:hypothetical protein
MNRLVSCRADMADHRGHRSRARNYYWSAATSCASAATIVVTLIARPLNYAGAGLDLEHCRRRHRGLVGELTPPSSRRITPRCPTNVSINRAEPKPRHRPERQPKTAASLRVRVA